MVETSQTEMLFGTLRDHAPEVETLKNTVEWRTSNFIPRPRTPDGLQGLTLPGVSAPARKVAQSHVQPPGQINRKDLQSWYEQQNLDKNKYTEHEWRQAQEYVRVASAIRKTSSSRTRSSSRRNRDRIVQHLEKKSGEVSENFDKRITDVDQASKVLIRCHEACEVEIKTMLKRITIAEEFMENRFEWPVQVNIACVKFRECRIGIDKVLDGVEIELLKEKDVIGKIVETVEVALRDAKAALQDLLGWSRRVAEDVDRKKKTLTLDDRMSRLESSRTLSVHLDDVKMKPATGLEVGIWRESSETLMEIAYTAIQTSSKSRKRMQRVCDKSELQVVKFSESVNKALDKSHKKAMAIRNEVAELLNETKREISITEGEIMSLERVIQLQETPLKRATTQLMERTFRPEGEQTIDKVHESLVEEVGDLDNAVSALTRELNINLQNLEDLRELEAMLEEDFAIKKNTVMFETRCVKARSYLSPDTDSYMVKKMMSDGEFFDVMTR